MSIPTRILFAGPTDATGAATIQVKAPASMYAVLTVIASAPGNPNWTVQAAGQLLTFGNGPQVNLGPLLTTPGENLQIVITGATPNSQASGTLAGNQYLTAEQAADNYQPMSNAISLNTFQGRQRLYPDGSPPATPNAPSFTVAPNTITSTLTFTLPAGTVSLRILAQSGGVVFRYFLLITGHVTLEQYWGSPTAPGSVQAVPSPTLPFTIPIENDWDSKVDIVCQTPSTNGATVSVFVSALFAPEFPGQAGAAQSVSLLDPQAWQAPDTAAVFNGANVNAGATFVMIAAPPATQRIRLHWVYLTSNAGAAAANSWLLDDGLGNRLSANSNSAQQDNNPMFNMDFKGFPVSAGNSVRATNQNAGALALYGSVHYKLELIS